MSHRTARALVCGLWCALPLALSVASGPAVAAPDPASPEPRTDSLIPVPAGCPQPAPADVAFVGTMQGKDDVTQTVRFRIEQVRAGSETPWAVEGLIDVRYGADYRFLERGHEYLVGAAFDPTYGTLSSNVRPPEPLFGGNDVVGVDDISVSCPTLDDPVRTLEVDGSSVDSGVMSLMTDDRRVLLATIAVPVALAVAGLVGLVLLKAFGGLGVQGLLQLGRSAVTPIPERRVGRTEVGARRHRDPDEVTSSVEP